MTRSIDYFHKIYARIKSTDPIYLLLGLIAVYVCTTIMPTIYSRLVYKGHIDHQEGLVLYLLHGFKIGKNIYQPPGLDFSGTIYAPFYFYFAYLFTDFFEINFFTTRLLSLICIGLTSVCAYVIVFNQTRNVLISISWLPLYLVYWPFFGWMDLGRHEALFMMLLFAGGAFHLTADGKIWRYALSGILFGLAIATKQPGIIMLIFIALTALFVQKTAWVSLIAALLTAGGIYTASYLFFGPSFLDWVYFIPKNHTLLSIDYILFFLGFWFSTCLGLMIFLGVFIVSQFFYQKQSSPQISFLSRCPILKNQTFLFIIAGTAISLIPLTKIGAGMGNFALVNAFCTLAALWALADCIKNTKLRMLVVIGFFFILSAVCAFSLNGSIQSRTPTQAQASGYEYLVKYVKNTPGDVWVMCAPWINIEAQKNAFVPVQQILEWTRGGGEFPQRELLDGAIAKKKFTAVLNCGDVSVEKKLPSHFIIPGFEKFPLFFGQYYQKSLKTLPVSSPRSIENAPLLPDAVWIRK